MTILEENIPLTHCVLTNNYSDYSRPNDKISYLLETGKLVALAKGKYVTPKAIKTNLFLLHQIANVLYGPSYISRFSALSYYGLLAESATTLESMTLKRSKNFTNALGRFNYYAQPQQAVFSIGVESKKLNNSNTILIASPEKAICDIIWTTPNLDLRTIHDLEYFLEEDLRIDIEMLSGDNLLHVENCVLLGKKKTELNLFLSLLKKIK